MSLQILFNGQVLRRPGGATKVDASAFVRAGLLGIGVVGLVGEADGGEPGSLQIFTDPALAKKAFRSGPLVDAAGVAFKPGKDDRVPGGAAMIVCYKTNQSTQSSLVLKNSGTDVLTLKSKDYGVHTNKLYATVSASGGGKVIQIDFEDGLKKTVETSPVLGGTAEFTVQYTGAGTAATMTITDDQLTTTVTGATGDSLALDFGTYTTLQELLAAISATGKYTATALTPNPYGFETKGNLDNVANVDVKTSAVDVSATLFRMIDWITKNSSLVSAEKVGTNLAGAPDAMTKTPLSGGTLGSSANSNFQAGFDALGTMRVNQVVPLMSADLPSPGTATIASVAAISDSHAAYYTSSQGQSERHSFVGFDGTKTAVLAQAALLQSFNTTLLAQYPTVLDSTSTFKPFKAWMMAVIAASMRAGSELGEPLTYKMLNVQDITQDASWSPKNDGGDMVQGGVMIAEAAPSGGFRWVKGNTTYTKEDNDAYTEESVVQGWKNISYELRTFLVNLFVGRKVSIKNVLGIQGQAGAKLSSLRDEGQITDSRDGDGKVTRGYSTPAVVASGDAASVSVTVSPAEGINYILVTEYLQPTSITV